MCRANRCLRSESRGLISGEEVRGSFPLGLRPDGVSHIEASPAVDALEDGTAWRARPRSYLRVVAERSRVVQRDQSIGPQWPQKAKPGDRAIRSAPRLCATGPSPLRKRDPQRVARGLFRKGCGFRDERAGPKPCGRTSRRSSLQGQEGRFCPFAPAPATSIGRLARVSLSTA
jgi:hypothetical protein